MMRTHFQCLLSQTANQPNKWLQPNAFRHVDVAKNTCQFKPSIRKENKGGLSNFKHSKVVGARQAGLNILETADLLGFLLEGCRGSPKTWRLKSVSCVTKMPC